MRIIKISALFLTLVMLLSGCAQPAGPQASDPQGTQSAQSSQTVSEPEPSQESSGTPHAAAPAAVEAVYPAAAGEGVSAQDFIMSEEYTRWWQDLREKIEVSRGELEPMSRYYKAILPVILGSEDDENTVCSPLNLYFAASMLAEITEGETRSQILSVLEADSLTDLRQRSRTLWESNCADTPVLKSIPANSVWLRDDSEYRDETLRNLADWYYASSFSGEMGSENFNEQLRTWTDEQTRGLLTDAAQQLSFDAETVLGLVSTIYYKAAWADEFSSENTKRETFHGTLGDRQVPMMHRDSISSVYEGENFTAAALYLTDSGSMNFFLPKENVSLEDLAKDPEIVSFCCNPESFDSQSAIVHLAVPKFEVSQDTDLLGAFRKLGITDAADREKADFSPLCEHPEGIYLSSVTHAAKVTIDEDGVTGAAFTMMPVSGAALMTQELYFTLDRPFLFTVTAWDGSILFAGTVQNV